MAELHWFKISSLSRSSSRGWQRLDLCSPADRRESKGDRKGQETKQRPGDKADFCLGREKPETHGEWAHVYTTLTWTET